MNRILSLVICLTAIFLVVSVAGGQAGSSTQSTSQTEGSHGSSGTPVAEVYPQAVTILRKAQEAFGGLRRLQAIHDVTREVEMVNLASKEKARTTSQIIFPDVIRLSTESPLGEVTAFSDGQSAWASFALGTDDRLPDWQMKASRQDLFRQLESLLQSDQLAGRKVEFVEHGKVERKAADILKISSSSAGSVRIWVDVASGDLLELEYQRIIARGEGPLVTDFYSDYRWVNKTVRVPFHTHTLSDGQPYMDTQVLRSDYNLGLKVDVLNQKPLSKQR